MEEVLPGIVGSLSSYFCEEAQSIRQLPDFLIQNTDDGSLSYLEVKYQYNGIFKRTDLPKDFKYTKALFIIVHKTGINCISFEELDKIGYLPAQIPFTLSSQKYFKLSKQSIKEFENYAMMLFHGVE